MDTKSTLYSALYKEDLAGALDLGDCAKKLSGKRVLIAGASGLVGTVLSDMILFLSDELALGTQLVLLSRNPDRLRVRYEGRGDVTLVSHDVNYPLRLEGRADYVVHAASDASPAFFASSPVEVMKANIFGTENLLHWGLEHGMRRFLYVSSGEVYGILDKEAISEGDCGYVDFSSSRSCYPSSKRAAETLCVSYAAEYNADIVIARPCHIYGALFKESDDHVFCQFARNALAGEDIVMKSTGSQMRSWCYVSDCATALLYVLLKGQSPQAYNIACADSVLSIKDLAQLIANLAGTKVVITHSSPSEKKGYSPVKHAVFDASKLTSLGWKARFSIQEGVSRTLAMLRGR